MSVIITTNQEGISQNKVVITEKQQNLKIYEDQSLILYFEVKNKKLSVWEFLPIQINLINYNIPKIFKDFDGIKAISETTELLIKFNENRDTLNLYEFTIN